MKLLVFPLIFLMFIGVLQAYGMFNPNDTLRQAWYDGSTPLSFNGNNTYFKDLNNRIVARMNGSEYQVVTDDVSWNVSEPQWIGAPINVTKQPYFFRSDTGVNAYMYFYVNSSNTYQCSRVSVSDTGSWFGVADVSGAQGVLAIVVALMALAGVVGFRILSSGVSSFAVGFIIFGVGLSALWLLLSAMATNLLFALPFGAGSIIYYGLTLCYCLGVFRMNAGSGGD